MGWKSAEQKNTYSYQKMFKNKQTFSNHVIFIYEN